MTGATRRTALVIGAGRPFGAEIVARLGADGYHVIAAADLADPAIAQAAAPLDAFILNAPVMLDGLRFRETGDDAFLAALTDQLFDLVAAGQIAVPLMTRGGRIVHVASRAHLGSWGGPHQIAAGAALVAMSRSMALELADQGIGVNVAAADYIGEPWDTPAARADLAAIVAFLAGPDSTLISGETILLNQDRSLRMTEGTRR